MIGFYNYTVYATFLSLVSAVTGIVLAGAGKPFYAVICLLISGGLDMIDGKIASTKKDRTQDEKNFGIQIDSLSDLVAFGVLPAMIVCRISDFDIIGCVVAVIYVLTALIRLAYYNVTEETRQKNETGRRKRYTGLPVTSSALIFPLLFIFSNLADKAFVYIMQAALLITAVLFITPFSIKKPGKAFMIVMAVAGVAIFALIFVFAR